MKRLGTQIMKVMLSRHVTQSLAYLNSFHTCIVALPTLVIMTRSKGDNYGPHSVGSITRAWHFNIEYFFHAAYSNIHIT